MNTLETMRLADQYATATAAAATKDSGALRFAREQARQALLAHISAATPAITDDRILELYDQHRPLDGGSEAIAFARAVLSAHGVTPTGGNDA